MFSNIHPIIGTRDIQRAIAFYTDQLGFKLAFADNTDAPNCVGYKRDAVEVHMQFQFEHEMSAIRLRFLVEEPDKLFDDSSSVASNARKPTSTIRHGRRVSSRFMIGTGTPLRSTGIWHERCPSSARQRRLAYAIANDGFGAIPCRNRQPGWNGWS